MLLCSTLLRCLVGKFWIFTPLSSWKSSIPPPPPDKQYSSVHQMPKSQVVTLHTTPSPIPLHGYSHWLMLSQISIQPLRGQTLNQQRMSCFVVFFSGANNTGNKRGSRVRTRVIITTDSDKLTVDNSKGTINCLITVFVMSHTSSFMKSNLGLLLYRKKWKKVIGQSPTQD